ncbi:2-keto-4-pentenoate hydratase [Asticcacaulis sp. EMRT-3]|uniref:2-keto-4-pentenoate hydratase n=1 Tax=Asticcacaulis sp. EMRT-3 TaxID=3040349 RepID=UPI0024AF21E2|nr:2-keto-4-pentenoate hydratase [Asticcacaulis sp. EMRT-3]MDI7776446.1 2-keto-4-pentenoate hydratase [Asticcacaulis sp. EMRT-3]
MTDSIADRFIEARRAARALPAYPGDVPANLSESYALQERAIGLWNRPVIGWKIGRLAPEKQAEHATERLAGPVFDTLFKPYTGETVEISVFSGGFAAVEAEFVFRIGKNADPAKTDYSEAEALALVDGMFAGIEMAGSPLATINALGPTVVASDFGNNFGLILGPQLITLTPDMPVADFQPEALTAWRAVTEMDGQVVGEGGLFTMPGGPLKAIGWLAGHLAQRGRPLTKGQLITSGATTGIHDIVAGQASSVRFHVPGQSDIVLSLHTTALTAGHAVLA